jgi:hypothetical protein
MTIYVVLARGDPPEGLEDAINANYGDQCLKYGNNIWFISSKDSTTRAETVSEKLGVKKGGIGRTLIMRITADYYGMSQTPIWDWLKQAFEQSDG